MTAAGVVLWVVAVAARAVVGGMAWRAGMPLYAGLMAVCAVALAWGAVR